jgi:predicted Zn-dependent protease
MERAVVLYQAQNGLKPDGVVGPKTIARMREPRCGVPDVVDNEAPQAFSVSGSRWPTNGLRYRFDNLGMDLSAAQVRAALRDAFDQWGLVTPLNFTQVDDGTDADIQIGWFSGDHGDGFPFDDAGGDSGNVLAHCFFPPPAGGSFPGDCHFDEHESWSVNLPPAGIDLPTVALHELGHGLGLRHSAVPSAVMFASYRGARRELTRDDIDGIRAIYGGWRHGVPGAAQVPVAAGTSPTSWYTTPENVQHIAYVGTDQQIHELFFFIR